MQDLIRVLNRSFLVFQRMNYLTVKKDPPFLPPNYLDYTDCSVRFELFYSKIRKLGILSNEDLDFVKASIKEAALSSY